MKRSILVFSLWMLGQAAWAGEAGSVLKADVIRAQPFSDAKVAGKLAAGDKLDILGKEGGWYKVKSAKGNGWVRMLSVRKGDARKGPAASGVLALSAGRAGTGSVVATTGIRGLNEEELKSAQFNGKELQLAESYSVKKTDAQKFAKQGKLVARPFDYLPAAQ